MAVDIYGKFNSIHSLAIYHSGYDKPSSAQIPKFSQHNKLCKIPLLSLRRHMHITGDPATFCPVCQGDMEKMLTFTTDGSQPLACAMLILFCWSHSMISVLSFTPLWSLWPTGHFLSQLSRLSFCSSAESVSVQRLEITEPALWLRHPFPFLSFTAVLTTQLLHYFCYVLLIMLAQQFVSSAILSW